MNSFTKWHSHYTNKLAGSQTLKRYLWGIFSYLKKPQLGGGATLSTCGDQRLIEIAGLKNVLTTNDLRQHYYITEIVASLEMSAQITEVNNTAHFASMHPSRRPRTYCCPSFRPS